jgi:tRNA(adenine34) deaminase
MDEIEQTAVDLRMMRRCIELAKTARKAREFPFACVIARGGEVIVETINEVARERDITRHAELVAVSRAQRMLKTRHLSGCALYTTVEPCPMCALAIRETRISRTVFALASPLMGGLSKWNVLRDSEISRTMPEYFGRAPPTVVAGLLASEAEAVWREAHPLVWAIIKRRGCFVVPHANADRVVVQSPQPGLFTRLLERFSL